MRMKNNDVLDNFMNGTGKGCENHSQNLYIDEKNFLINYATVIALFYDGNLILNKTKYSSTTSKHQNYLRRYYKGKLLEVDKDEMCDYITKATHEYYSRA